MIKRNIKERNGMLTKELTESKVGECQGTHNPPTLILVEPVPEKEVKLYNTNFYFSNTFLLKPNVKNKLKTAINVHRWYQCFIKVRLTQTSCDQTLKALPLKAQVKMLVRRFTNGHWTAYRFYHLCLNDNYYLEKS